MSFSSRVKEELSRRIPDARHCRIAEISAILGMCGTVGIHEDSYHIRIYTENVTVARKLFLLLKETFGIRGEILIRQSHTPYSSPATANTKSSAGWTTACAGKMTSAPT